MSISELLEKDGEKEMQDAFERQASEVLENEEKYRKTHDNWIIGLEVEYGSVDSDLNPPSREARNNIINSHDFLDFEVGASQIEAKTRPLNLSSISQLENQLATREKQVLESAENEDIRVLRAGTNPFVNLDEVERTDKPKYEIVPNFHDNNRHDVVQSRFGSEPGEEIDPRNAEIAALINAAQVNVEAKGFDDAVEKANFTYMITPYITALSANSRFLDHGDLGCADSRMPLWEKSHDLRSEDNIPEETIGPGKLGSYFEDLEDYFGRVQEQPFIIHETDAAMDIGIGTYWKDARIKFVDEPETNTYDLVVESRGMSTQPTLKEEIAMEAFYIGRLAYAQSEELHSGSDEDKLDIDKVNRNRYSAMYNGLETKLYSPDGELKQAEKVLGEEISKAEQGLESAGIEYEDKYFDILYNRIEEGTPATQMAEGYKEVNSGEFKNEEEYRKQALLTGLLNQKDGIGAEIT